MSFLIEERETLFGDVSMDVVKEESSAQCQEMIDACSVKAKLDRKNAEIVTPCSVCACAYSLVRSRLDLQIPRNTCKLHDTKARLGLR